MCFFHVKSDLIIGAAVPAFQLFGVDIGGSEIGREIGGRWGDFYMYVKHILTKERK